MLALKKLSPEVFQATAIPVHWGQEELTFLKAARQDSPRKRCRILCHKNVQEALHEMLVAYGPETYIRPNKHPKDESVLVLEGTADLLFFDDFGQIIKAMKLAARGTRNPYYCRLPANVFHTLILRSECVFLEATPGPFTPADVEYAGFAPAEGDRAKVSDYQKRLEPLLRNKMQFPSPHPAPLTMLTPQVYQANDTIAHWGGADESLLKSLLVTEQLERVRVCAHRSKEEKFHEMLMVFKKSSYVRPSKHTDKEESLYVLDGLGVYTFFDHSGDITESVQLGPLGSGRSCYCRIPANSWHALVLESDMIVKETAQGPFDKGATVFPEWAPVDGSEYVAKLRARLKG